MLNDLFVKSLNYWRLKTNEMMNMEIKTIFTKMRLLRWRISQGLFLFLANIVTIPYPQTLWRLKNILLQVAGLQIKGSVFIDRGFRCLFPENILIENCVSMGHDNHIWAFAPVQIGKYTQTAKDLLIISGSHNVESFENLSEQEVSIGAGCWIGARVTILGGVKIGKGCVIGACSLVRNDIPDWSVAAGVPARVIRQRIPAEKIFSPFGIYCRRTLKNVRTDKLPMDILEQINYPLISVVIPSFNQGNYIEETILSVIGQEYPKLELIIIDGGSTDNTVEIIKKYSNKIAYWHSKPDKGQGDAINQGMNLSSGAVLCWLNSDDMYLPGTLLDIGRKFARLTDQNYLIYGITMIIQQDSDTVHSISHPIVPFDPLTLTYNDFIGQPSAFWTRKLWQSTGELNLNYNYVLDWDWFIRASKITKFDYVPKVYAIYRNHSINKTNSGGSVRRKEILEVVNKYSSEYWRKLYLEVERYYPKIAEFINKNKLPKRTLLLPLFFPKVSRNLKNIQDLYKVLTMYG